MIIVGFQARVIHSFKLAVLLRLELYVKHSLTFGLPFRFQMCVIRSSEVVLLFWFQICTICSFTIVLRFRFQFFASIVYKHFVRKQLQQCAPHAPHDWRIGVTECSRGNVANTTHSSSPVPCSTAQGTHTQASTANKSVTRKTAADIKMDQDAARMDKLRQMLLARAAQC